MAPLPQDTTQWVLSQELFTEKPRGHSSTRASLGGWPEGEDLGLEGEDLGEEGETLGEEGETLGEEGETLGEEGETLGLEGETLGEEVETLGEEGETLGEEGEFLGEILADGVELATEILAECFKVDPLSAGKGLLGDTVPEVFELERGFLGEVLMLFGDPLGVGLTMLEDPLGDVLML